MERKWQRSEASWAIRESKAVKETYTWCKSGEEFNEKRVDW